MNFVFIASVVIIISFGIGVLFGRAVEEHNTPISAIRLSIWDSMKIFKFDALTLHAGVQYYLKLEEMGKGKIELVVLKEVGRSIVMAEPKRKEQYETSQAGR